MTTAARPAPTEYAPDYDGYISRVPEGDIIATMETQGAATAALLRGLPEEKCAFRYAEGKWSVAELMVHVIDAERVFTYRVLCVARGDQTPLPGFDQDDYVPQSNAGNRSLTDLAEEFEAVRRSTLLLLRHLPDEAWSRMGIANNNPVSVRALAYIMAGHELHHVNILRERYLP